MIEDNTMKKKVIYIGASQSQVDYRGNDDPRPLLTEGDTYEVATWNELAWHTHVTLKGISGTFNSVHFELI